ncbi:member of major facilitator superfamily multidrug-resistance, DHA1 sub-family [Mycena leptocephala]|nr:member of major facilitator superfamily multidrug-resistance, DHA1 sub-family [Mycena leptocephala]
MSPRDNDETQPLLGPRNDRDDFHDLHSKRTPLPVFQLCIVLFLQLAEPLTSQVIYPFAPQLMRDIGITNGDETKVGYYQSLFFLTQAFTVLHWSRLSDRIGRKPVILMGLMGLSISMFCFGLSRTFWGLVLSRSLNGALNGTSGIVAELTDSTNIAQAYAYMPSCVHNLTRYFSNPTSCSTSGALPRLIWEEPIPTNIPYFLPCAVPATFSVIAWVVTFLFLKETATGPTVLTIPRIFRKKNADNVKREAQVEAAPSTVQAETMGEPVPLRGLLTRQVIVAASNYAFLSLVDIALRAIHPVFLATPIELGGLGLPTVRIGNLLSVFGVLNGIFQVFFFAGVHDYLGTKMMFTLPRPRRGNEHAVWALAVAQIIMSIGLSFSYGAVFIYISAAAPNRASLGATNGLCQLSVSLMRTIGPAAANSLFSLSMEKGYMHGYMVYYVLMATTCVALWVAAQLPRRP